jgi:hypothetical protein
MLMIISEYVACLLAALISGTLLFTVGAMCVTLWAAGGITWRWWRELALVPIGLPARWTAEPREP